MSRFIELSAVDESGSGLLFPALVNVDDIVTVLSIEGHSDLMPNATTVIFLRHSDQGRPLYTTARYTDLRDILQGETK